MNAGTSTSRTNVASTRIASVRPVPNNRMTDTWAAINAANEIAMISAAAVITRPVPARPPRMACSLLRVRSQTSRIRLTRKTS